MAEDAQGKAPGPPGPLIRGVCHLCGGRILAGQVVYRMQLGSWQYYESKYVPAYGEYEFEAKEEHCQHTECVDKALAETETKKEEVADAPILDV